MRGGVFGFFPEWKWQGYLLVDAWTYSTKPSRLLFLQGYEVLCHTRARGVLARILRENSAMLDTLRKTYRITRYARESDTLEALEWLLGSTFTPHEATVNPFAQLIIFEREQPKAVPQPEVQRERSRPPPPPLSARSSWVRIACVDDSELSRPVPGVALEVVTASAEVRTSYTNQDGVAYVDGIAPGRVSIRVLGRDGRTWRPLEGDAAAPCSADERFTWHQVQRGEHLSKIARRYGIEDWRDIWTFRKNEALRRQRKSPHVLHPGDMLAVPALQLYEISRQTEQTHRIEVERGQVRRGYVLESHELRFHAQSGVLLAQYTPEGEAEVRSDAPALDALATTLLHAEENPARSLLLVGHSEVTETPEGDRKLSEVRAEGVRHMLRGDRDAWVALAREHSCSEDPPAILHWCAEARDWPCAPATNESTDESANAESALRAFQEAYNQSHDASIAEDGALGPETWGAIFDVYQHQLATRLETDAAGLAQRQRALQFCEAAESYGCGSALSIHARSGAEGASFRRADVQFFEPSEEPAARDLEQGQLAEPDFAFTPFSLREAPKSEVRVAVRELVYPGTEGDSVPLEGKWLYAIADGSLAFSVEAASATEWQVTGAAAAGLELVRDGNILLQAKQSYRLFLSPVPLTERALERLCSNLDECLWSTIVDRPGEEATLLVRDVFQWALDLHDREYLPQLDAWQSWLQDEERAARHFIASALKCIIDQGDEPGIQRHLRSGEPKTFLDQHIADEKTARRGAEQAAFQLASFVDCEDHRIIEQAHTDAGTEGVELAVVHWACVLGDLAQTFEGRQLLDVVAKDAARVPRRFVFADPPPLELGFSEKRYLALAGRALLKDLGPALLAHLYPRQTVREAVAQYLERLGEAKPLLGTYRQIYANATQGRKLTRKVKSKKSLQKLINTVTSITEAVYEAPLPRALLASERLEKAYERNLRELDAGTVVVLEVVNLYLASRRMG